MFYLSNTVNYLQLRELESFLSHSQPQYINQSQQKQSFTMDKRNLFESDSQVSDEEPQSQQSPQKKASSNDLYQENFHKYVNRLKELNQRIDSTEEQCFGDGIWYVNHPLIAITQINYEKNLGIFDIVDMEEQNSSLTHKKLVVIFTFIDNEIQKILEILQLNLYDSLIMYGEEANQKGKNKAVDVPELMTAKILGVYKKVYDLVKKLMAYIENLILQLHSVVNRKCGVYKTQFKSVNWDPVLDLVGKALRAIYVVDCIVQNNANIDAHWEQYKKMLKMARNEPEKFGTSLVRVKKLEKQCGRLEKTVLSKECMRTITEIAFDEVFDKTSNPLGKIKANRELREYYELYFERKLREIDEALDTPLENDEERRLLDLMCGYSLFRKLFPGEEARGSWKQLWAMQKKIPIIEAHSFVCVYICTFMQQVCPLSKKPRSMEPSNEAVFLKGYLVKMEEVMGMEIVSYYTKFCVWLSRMESVVTSNSSLRGVHQISEKTNKVVQERLGNRILLLIEGVNIVLKLNRFLYLCLVLHSNESRGIRAELLGKLVLGMETVKAASYIIRKKIEAFDTMVLTRTLTKDLVAAIDPLYAKLHKEESNRREKENMEKLQLLGGMLALLRGPISELKLTLIKYSFGVVQNWAFREEERAYVTKALLKIEFIFYNQVLIQKYENCSYLYLVKDMLPQIFEFKRENPSTCKRLQFLFQAFEDPAHLIGKCVHLTDNEELFREFKRDLIGSFEAHYMLPLKRKVEDFLRISTHSMLLEKVEGVQPFEREVTDLIKMLQLEKIRVFDSVVDLRTEISSSFNSSFYNLNVLNMHDMETYEQMRVMSGHLFGLRLHDAFLPSQTIEQGKFDILKIIRNIPEFICAHKYNLLSQRFLEVTGPNKIISSVGIQQLSDSIRTHGLGILSTTVNAFYKFLVGKVQAFSKLLYHEGLKNLLSKEKKWLKEHAEVKDYPGYYPYERAQHLYKEVKKLGRFEDDANYLDRLREIVTHVGNTLGFIRLLRSASLNSSSKSVEYLPKKVEIGESFEELSAKAGMGSGTSLCAKELDELLRSLEDKFGAKTDYMNLMVKAFGKITSKENKHLKLFYMVVPALTLNYVEHVARGKEQIAKKISSGAFLYDDGFTLGLSYFVNLLRQNEYVKVMHWDRATRAYFDSAKNYSKQQTDSSQHSAKFLDDLNMQQQLLIKKLETMSLEFVLMQHNIQSANVLFKGGAQEESKNAPTSPPSGEQA